MAIETYTLESQIDRLSEQAWPEFLLHGDTRHWGSLFSTFTAYQIVFYEPGDCVIAFGHCIPLVWDGTLDDTLHGYTFETRLVIASTDALAADLEGAKLFGFNVDAVHHLRKAGSVWVKQTQIRWSSLPSA